MKNIFSVNYKIIEGELICSNCEEVLTIEQVLESSSVSWPGLNWIYCKCPLCNEHMHVEVLSGSMRTGQLDGAPGPVFFPCSEVMGIDLTVNASNELIECTYNDTKYRFKAR